MQPKHEGSNDLFLSSLRAEDPETADIISAYHDRGFEDSVGEHCFSLDSGRVVFGIPLLELDDSFMLAMPAILVGENGLVRGKSLVIEPLIRLYKSGLSFSCRTPEMHRYHYYEYLLRNAARMPELLNEDVQDILAVLLAQRPAKDLPDIEGEDSPPQEQASSETYLPYNNKTRH